MPYRVCRIFEVENGHMLSKHPDKCRFPHGHSRRIECVLEADDLDGREMVCDFKVLKLALAEYLERYDHALCVNTADPAYGELKARYGERVLGYENEDPTTEILARDIFRHLQEALSAYLSDPAPGFPLRPGVRVVSVKVWETSGSWAEFLG
jgi:6-pyruvoyltetrahydropterin/6-carboxytetrahydropterin synthase